MHKSTIKNFVLAVAVIAVCIFLAMRILPRWGDAGDVQTSQGLEPVVFEGSGDWPMFHGDQHLVGRAAGSLPDKLEPLWKFKTDGAITASPVIEAGIVYVGSTDANVYAIDMETGSKVWAEKVGDAIEAAACVVDDSVYVGAGDGFLYSLNKADGSLRWKYETDGQIVGGANWTLSPDGSKTWILVGSYDNAVHCVDAESGKPIWKCETDNYVNGTPAVDEGRTVFGGCDAIIHVVSLADGAKIKGIDSSAYIAGSAAFLDGCVYVGNYDGEFLKADVASGSILWRYGDKEAPFLSTPAIGSDVVVIGGRDNNVHCISRDKGEVVWIFKTLGEVDGSPVICGDKVVIGSGDGRLYMIRMSDGTQVWSYEIGQPLTSSPAVARGVVVIGSEDEYVYAFGSARVRQDRKP